MSSAFVQHFAPLSCYFHQFFLGTDSTNAPLALAMEKQTNVSDILISPPPSRDFLDFLETYARAPITGRTRSVIRWPVNEVHTYCTYVYRYVAVLKYDHRLTMSKRVQRVIFYLYSVISHSTIPTMRCVLPRSLFAFLTFSWCRIWGKFSESSCFALFRAFRSCCSWIPRASL